MAPVQNNDPALTLSGRPGLRPLLFLVALLGALAGCRVRPARPAPAEAPRAAVVFDQSLDQIYSPFDTSFAGMSSLAAALRRRGATVSVSSIPLARLVASFSGRRRVLVLGPATYRRYRPSERAAVARFLAGGGGVLVLVVHDDLHQNATMQNELTGPYGIAALPGSARGRGPTPRARAWPLCRAARWGLRDVEPYLAAPLRVTPPARPLLEVRAPLAGSQRTVAATRTVGRGRLAVLGDAEILWNMSPRSGSRRPANRAFLLRLFRWLARGRLAGPGRPPTPWEATGPRGTVLFDDSGAGLGPDDSPSGLGRFARALQARGYGVVVGSPGLIPRVRPALVVVAVPAEPPRNLAALTGARRLLVAGDAGSDLIGAHPRLRHVLRGFGERPVPFPPVLDPLGRRFGIRWRAVTVVGPRRPQLQPGARWLDQHEPWRLHRAGALEPRGTATFPANIRVLAQAAAGTWTEVNLVGPTGDRGPRPLSRPAALPPGSPAVVAAAAPRFFALADVDALGNQLFDTPTGQALFRRILRWLERP